MPEEQIVERLEFLDRRIKDPADQIGRWMNATDAKILSRLDRLEKNVIDALEKLRSESR
jgi:hypothetical protein